MRLRKKSRVHRLAACEMRRLLARAAGGPRRQIAMERAEDVSRTPGPPLPRLLASLAIGVVLVAAGWWFMENIPAAMLAEADAAKFVVVAGGR
jgi:hypothetical protein